MKKFLFLFLTFFIAQLTFGQIVPPYTNYLDTPSDTVGWSHYAISGSDDWEFGNLLGSKWPYSIDSIGWGTNLISITGNSVQYLESPFFDLSDTSETWVLNLSHYYDASYVTEYFRVEYSLDSGTTWNILSKTGSRYKNWYSGDGFKFGISNNEKNATIELNQLRGESNVKFRFKAYCQYDIGWAIYGLSVKAEENIIDAWRGDSILDINQNYASFEISNSFEYRNQWQNSQTMVSSFYLSNDSILDPSDIFIANDTTNLMNYSNHINNWTRRFNMPSNITSGTYYIIYHLNSNDSIKESNYSDNISYAVMVLDPIFTMPYAENFDSTVQFWGAPKQTDLTEWSTTIPNPFGIEKARSGSTGWYSGEEDWNTHFDLESPYLDFSNSVNSVFCFWFKAIGAPYYNYQFKLNQAHIDTSYINPPYYNASISDITRPSTMYWDCHCEDISRLDGIKSTKLKLTASGEVHYNMGFRIFLDDIYMGSAKPDLAIEGEKDLLFLSANQLTDSITYTLVNSGLDSATTSITNFYWSNDSILDATDFLLGSQNESGIPDTTLSPRSFSFTKPHSTPGTYYIFYVLDAANNISEMRENDNIGYLKVRQVSLLPLPYFNDFENSITGWTSSATNGKNEWQWSIPQGSRIDSAFSGIKGFITNDTGIVSTQSRMHLMTPIFDLSQLQRPVLEFDMLLHTHGVAGYGLWPFNAANIMYSINGGANWSILEPTNQSYKRMYTRLEFEKTYGNDRVPINGSESSFYTILYGDYLKGFLTHKTYQGRDYENNSHQVVDLSFLQSETQIQFMFVYANFDSPMEGMLLDNFGIKEGLPDLMNPSSKKLMTSGNDKIFNHHFNIKNNSNYISNPSQCKFYLSTDTIINSSDYLISVQNLPEIPPYKNHYLEIKTPTPPGFENYQYILFEIDPNNTNTEANKNNNLSYLELKMDSTDGFHFPVLFDFNTPEVDGWSWYQDNSGKSSSNHRFALSRTDEFSTTNNTDHHWFLDPQYTLWDYDNYPIHFLESPTYDFTNAINIKIEFDFVCAGYGYTKEGGRMEYSENGGVSWRPLGKYPDTNGVNWYTGNNISSIGGGPGWTEEQNWKKATYSADLFTGKPSVKFRFIFRSNTQIAVPFGLTGFKLDNFKIEANYLTSLPDVIICPGETASIFGSSQSQEGIYFYFNPSTDSNFSQALIFNQLDTSITHHFHLLESNQDSASYQWLDCANQMTPIPNETNQIFYPQVDGTYAVSITKDGCIDTSSCRDFVITGTDEKYTTPEIQVFPNPTDHFLTINLGQFHNSILIEITATDGKQLYQHTHQSIDQLTMDFDYPTGIYFVRVSISDEEPKVFKVFKN